VTARQVQACDLIRDEVPRLKIARARCRGHNWSKTAKLATTGARRFSRCYTSRDGSGGIIYEWSQTSLKTVRENLESHPPRLRDAIV